MRLRRLEMAIVALTLAFACFTGGYFTGRKGAVNVVAVTPFQHDGAAGAANDGSQPTAPQGGEGTQTDGGGNTQGQPQPSTAAATDSASQQPANPAAPDVGAPIVSDGKININTASRGELTDLPGIGDTLAGRIIDYRAKNGPFQRIEDIKNVSGIGEKRYEAIEDRIKVG
jgi:comEA protein